MKKITQRAVFLLLIMGSLFCRSQESSEDQKKLFYARQQLIEGSNYYNPEAAITTFKQIAEKGNPQAMNGLGLIYSKGLGGSVNVTEGIKWFEKAAENGYANAWFNLALLYKEGIGETKDPIKAMTCFEKAAKSGYSVAWQRWAEMYKDGDGVPQNYRLAMDIFKEGADNGNIHCLYSQGYLYYKGFGCTQDYGKAIELFELASQKGNGSAMYMLGLCYRNGYGTTINTEKATYWLKKSAALGIKLSERELAESEPENANPNQTKTVSKPIEEVITIAETEAPKAFKKLKQSSINTNISGHYTGNLLCYDWSGQNIISSTPLEIVLNQEGKQLTGEWKEEKGDTSLFTADIKENAIVFNDSKIDRLEYFHKNIPITYDFKEAQLQLLQTDESLFIIGNLQLYDSKRHENEKPMYLILEKKQEKTTVENQILSSVIIYPNPIISEFNLSFDLTKTTDVTMEIYNINGAILHNQEWKGLTTGHQSKTLTLSAPSGYYLLRLKYDNETKTTILIKK